MSVLGMDFGNLDCVIAQAKRGGIDIVLNENSNRKNPNMVCLHDNQRFIGEPAVSVARMHFKDCATNVKRLIGRAFASEEAQNEIKNLPFECVELPNGEVGIVVNYKNEVTGDTKSTFTCQQVVAMMLAKLASVAAAANNSTNATSADIVVSVPGYFTDIQRRALLAATDIAGLKCLRLMNEHTAIALAYGIYKSARNLFDAEKPSYVMFIDMGHTAYTVSVVAFVQGKLNVKSVAYNTNLGGRDFDEALAAHVAAEFKEKYKVDPLLNSKSRLKLLGAAEKAKKNLSPHGVTATNLSVECLVEEYDYNGRISLETFEGLITDTLLSQLQGPIDKALGDAGITAADLSSVEIVGGATRVASVKRTLSSILSLDASKNNYGLSTTLNADESVARGCALQSAILSPMFKVKDFAIADIVSRPIRVSWEGKMQVGENENEETEEDDSSIVILKTTDDFPKTRRITFKRSEAFSIDAAYDNEDDKTAIGTFKIDGIPPLEEGQDPRSIRVNVRQDLNGIFGVSSCQMMQEIIEEPKEPTEETEKETETSEAPKEEKEKEKEKEEAPKKKRFRKVELSITSTLPSAVMTSEEIKAAFEKEVAMLNSDRVLEETANMRNSLESFIYELRNNISDKLSSFLSSDDKKTLEDACMTAEDWLYSDEGFDSQKSVYAAKLKDLTDLGAPAEFRLSESTARPAAQKELLALVEEYKSLSNDLEKTGHWEEGEKSLVRDLSAKAEAWIYEQMSAQGEKDVTDVPVITSSEIRSKLSELRNECRAVVTKPLPKKEEPAPAPEEEDKKEEAAMDLD